MAILNATTTISAEKTIQEIQALLIKRRAQSMTIEMDEGRPVGLRFQYQGEVYMLPCRAMPIYTLLRDTPGLKRNQRTLEHAERVGWRIVKSWLLAQFAIIDSGMVALEEVMLPYMLIRPGVTAWQVYTEQRAERLLEDKR